MRAKKTSKPELEEGLEKERKSFYKLLDSENGKEGISSFLNKIKPNWVD